MIRKTLFWIHLAAGASLGVVILIMSVTGVLLTYQKQMTTWADLRHVAASAGAGSAAPLTADELIERVSAARPGQKPTTMVWRSHAAPVEVVFGRDGRAFVDPASGAVLGSGSDRMRKFFQSVTEWHRWLGRKGPGRESGAMITGFANLAFLLLVVTGAFLWWPRNWSKRALRNVMLFRRGLRSKARDFNWHHVVGFWGYVPLFIVVLSGVVISYGWAGDLVYRMVGESPPGATPRPASAAAPSANTPATSSANARIADYESMVREAQAQTPGWRTITLQIPAAASHTVTVSADRGNGGQPQKRTQLKFDRATGSLSESIGFSDSSRGRRLRTILRFAHTGEIAGLAGQTLAGVVSLGAALLVYTGLALSIRRFIAWQRRMRQPATQ
jgi:uncharacterized iron-regulated membrane protein